MEYLESLEIFPYIFSVVIFTWILLKMCFKNPVKQKTKLIVTGSCGFFLGIIWYYTCAPKIDLLILGFFASAGLYDYILKFIFKKFKIY